MQHITHIHYIIESYISIDMSFEYRMLFANFRCSDYNLMIEKERHVSIDSQFRFCPICYKNNVHVVNDEYHFFLGRKAYDQIRNARFKQYCIRNE